MFQIVQYMKKLFFSFVLCLSALTIFAQSDSSEVLYKKGIAEHDARRYMVAYNLLQKAVELKPENAEAQMALGRTAVELRKFDVARNAFLKGLELKKNDVNAVENVANLSFNLRKWNEAIEYAKKMQILKSDKNANYIIGKSYYELEDYGQAYKHLNAAFQEDPKNAEIPYLIGRGFIDMSNYRAAAPFMEQAVKLDTTNARRTYECALNFSAIPDENSAIKYFLLAAQRGYKMDNDYYENLANSYIAVGKPQEGIDIMKKLLEKKPADLVLLYNIAEAHYKIAKYQEAIDYWDRILSFDKTNARALYMIGLSYQKKGDTAKGQQLCDKAIEMDPSLASLKQKKQGMGL